MIGDVGVYRNEGEQQKCECAFEGEDGIGERERNGKEERPKGWFFCVGWRGRLGSFTCVGRSIVGMTASSHFIRLSRSFSPAATCAFAHCQWVHRLAQDAHRGC